jgi:orotate phosphoribosyltransferase
VKLTPIERANEVNAQDMLEKYGCIYEGHFVGISTKHLAGYCNIDPLIPHVAEIGQLIKELVSNFSEDGVEVVASPAVGAIPFAHWGAQHLMAQTGRDILGVWADKVSGAEERKFIFEREGFAQAVKDKKVLILEDMINQMKSVKAMIETVTAAGGTVIGVGCIAANKGVSAEALGVPAFYKLAAVEYDSWTLEECMHSGLCSKHVPIVEDIGHGHSFKLESPEYSGGYVKLLNEN